MGFYDDGKTEIVQLNLVCKILLALDKQGFEMLSQEHYNAVVNCVDGLILDFKAIEEKKREKEST